MRLLVKDFECLGGDDVKAGMWRVDTVGHRRLLKEQLTSLTEGRVPQKKLPACSTCIFTTWTGKVVDDQCNAEDPQYDCCLR